MLVHLPSFGRNPRGSPDFLAYPVPKACMHVLGTGVPRRLGVARSASSPKAAQALGCSLTPGLRISFGRVTCMTPQCPGYGHWVSYCFLRHGGPPPKALHQSGLTMGKKGVHGELKFSEGQPRVFTNPVRVKTLHELHHGPEKVKILVEAISVKDAKGYIAYNKAKCRITKR